MSRNHLLNSVYLVGWSSEYKVNKRQKIYAWIKQIPPSNKVYIISKGNSIIVPNGEENIAAIVYVPSKDKTICPALMFAANRKERVIGRAMILVVSIITRNGFNHIGAPPGNKFAKKEDKLYEIADIIILNHKTEPKETENKRCLDVLKA